MHSLLKSLNKEALARGESIRFWENVRSRLLLPWGWGYSAPYLISLVWPHSKLAGFYAPTPKERLHGKSFGFRSKGVSKEKCLKKVVYSLLCALCCLLISKTTKKKKSIPDTTASALSHAAFLGHSESSLFFYNATNITMLHSHVKHRKITSWLYIGTETIPS